MKGGKGFDRWRKEGTGILAFPAKGPLYTKPWRAGKRESSVVPPARLTYRALKCSWKFKS